MSESEDKGILGIFGKLLELAKTFSALLLLIGLFILVLGLQPGFSWEGVGKHPPFDSPARGIAVPVGLVLMGLGVLAGFVRVFPSFGEERAGLSAKEVKGYDVTITSPEPLSPVKEDFRIRGTYKKLPEQVQMAILENHGGLYWRRCGVHIINRKDKTWVSDVISVGNAKGNERVLNVVVMDEHRGGKVIYDHFEEVDKQIRKIREFLPPEKAFLPAGYEPAPGWKGRPCGMFECTKIRVYEA